MSSVILALSFMVAACGADDRGPIAVSLEQLAGQQGSYEGKLVRTGGIVRSFGDDQSGRHFWIENPAQDRVGIRPEHLAAPLLGRRVRVTGRFESSETVGRSIEVRRIEPISVAPDRRRASLSRHRTRRA